MFLSRPAVACREERRTSAFFLLSEVGGDPFRWRRSARFRVCDEIAQAATKMASCEIKPQQDWRGTMRL
jgi:hypothetical protein